MKLNKRVLPVVTISLLSLMAATRVFAVPGYPTERQSKSENNIRSTPKASSSNAHDGSMSDLIQVINFFDGDGGYDWYYVRFPSGAHGWIRGEYVQEPKSMKRDRFMESGINKKSNRMKVQEPIW